LRWARCGPVADLSHFNRHFAGADECEVGCWNRQFRHAGARLDRAERTGNIDSIELAALALEWQHKNPGRVGHETADAMPLLATIDSDPLSYKSTLADCANRTANDPRFNRFAHLMR
jgi:hypothetical protein